MTDYKTIAESNYFIVLDKYNKDWGVAASYQSEGGLLMSLRQSTRPGAKQEAVA